MRRCLHVAHLFLLLVLSAGPAWAGEEGGGLDLVGQAISSWAAPTAIGVFLILLVILSKTAWKPILAGLQRREETIKKALDDAKEAHESAKALIAEYESRIDHAREEAQAIFEEARRDAQDIRAQIEEDARKRADETVARAGREIDQMTAKAWDALVRDAASVATEAASRIIQRELTPEGHAAIVAGVVGDFARRAGRDAKRSGSEPQESA